MVIRSKFKDYYDFVANRFGGGDPRIVYSRGRIQNQYVDAAGVKLNDPRSYNRYYMANRGPDVDYLYLVICGKVYLLARPTRQAFEKFDVNAFSVIDINDEAIPRWIRYRKELEFGQEYPFLVDLCRKVGAPVFVIHGISYKTHSESTVEICEQCPILGSIGMASRIDPYQMYQEIAVFMGNRMSKTPDMQPPVELDNTQRILKAGFDLRKSFRHRT